MVKPKIEHRQPTFVGFFIVQCAKQRTLELYHHFFKNFCYADKYEELEMDTDSHFFALSEENLEDVILYKKQDQWKAMLPRNCTDHFTANAKDSFFPRICGNTHKKHDTRDPGLFNKEFRCAEILLPCSETYCCYD